MDINPIGVVRKSDTDKSIIELDESLAEGLLGLEAGVRLDVLYWMHELTGEHRRMLRVHPRGDKSNPVKGVFALRSPMRPNPIGVSMVELIEVNENLLVVRGLDAHDGSPVLDIKSARTNRELNHLIEMWGHVHDVIFSALEEECGRDKLEQTLREPLRRAGRESARESLPDASAIGRAIMAIEKLWGIKGKIVEQDEGKFVREVTDCPWSYFRPLGCEVFAWWMEGFVSGSGSDYNYHLEQSIPAGADTCIWSVRKRR